MLALRSEMGRQVHRRQRDDADPDHVCWETWVAVSRGKVAVNMCFDGAGDDRFDEVGWKGRDVG